MEALRIVFRFASPVVVPDRALHLDALLAAAMFKIAVRNNSPDPVSESNALDLVLGKEHGPSDSVWVWQASQLHWKSDGPAFHQHYIRRFEIQRWAEDKVRGIWAGSVNSISPGTGHMKAYASLLRAAWINEAVAWCIGDREMVNALLTSEIDAIGRHVRSGWGRIAEITVDGAPADESEFWRRRALPLEMERCKTPDHFASTATVRPPYWDRARWQPAWELNTSGFAAA